MHDVHLSFAESKCLDAPRLREKEKKEENVIGQKVHMTSIN